MYDFFVSIPKDLEESAELDGASKIRIFLEIILPLAKPGLVATSLLVLILAWNEYLLALFLSTAKAQTIPLLVAAQNATRGPQWWYMSVLIIIMIVPVDPADAGPAALHRQGPAARRGQRIGNDRKAGQGRKILRLGAGAARP